MGPLGTRAEAMLPALAMEYPGPHGDAMGGRHDATIVRHAETRA